MIAAAVLVSSLYSSLVVRRYTVYSAKTGRSGFRIAFLSDLHSCRYGDKQSLLLKKIAEQEPDAVVMTGDIADDRMPMDGTLQLLAGLQGKYPCFYVTGNHEYLSGRVEKIKDIFRSYGVTVLEGGAAVLEVDGQKIYIAGVDDLAAGREEFSRQLKAADAACDSSYFSVLLSHRPEQIARYAEYDFDLVLAGHAHGGQVRIPFLLNGLIAPGEGLFPKYAGGEYTLKNTQMIVSRGLARESTPIVPRIYNPPELVVVDILPAAD